MTKHTLIKKRARLDRAKSQLKAEFFGIDAVTDQLVDATSSWYLTPELQDLPMVVNRRGLTGVDKTSLVMRLAEEFGITNDTYHFDLGEQQNGNNPVQTAIIHKELESIAKKMYSEHRQMERVEFIRLARELGVNLDVDATLADRTRSFYRSELKRKENLTRQSLQIAV